MICVYTWTFCQRGRRYVARQGSGSIRSLASPQFFPEINNNTLVIFLKHFDVSKQHLYGIGKMYVQRGMKVADLTALINERLRWPTNTPLKFFEEIKPGMIELMKMKATFAQSEIQDGDVICFQVELPEKE
jgi:ubiquitin carboxyl-terminal hydrolase 7